MVSEQVEVPSGEGQTKQLAAKRRRVVHPMMTDTFTAITVAELPETVQSHVGMISMQERRLLYGLAKEFYTGKGVIVDAGTFLGASTVAFAQGLRDNPLIDISQIPNKPIHGFERAIAGTNLAVHTDKVGLPAVPVGESFEGLLRELIEPVSDLVTLHIGDILQYTGDDLHDIEICFLDILKMPEVSRHALRVFVPKMLPGCFIIQQDYFFSDLPYIKVFNEALADKLRYLGEVRSSAVFQLIEPITDAELDDALSALDDLDRAITLHKQAEARTISPARQYMMRLSRALLYAQADAPDLARETLSEADRQFVDIARDDDGNYRDNMKWRVDSLMGTIQRKESRKS